MKLKDIVSLKELPIKIKKSCKTKFNCISGMYIPTRHIQNHDQISKFELFAKIVNDLQPLTLFTS